MDQKAQVYEELIQRLVAWASGEQDIRAAVVIGSRARADHPADEWADLDVIVVTRDSERLVSTTDWLQPIGVPTLTFVETQPSGGKERRVLFGGGVDVDFAIQPYEDMQRLFTHGISPSLARELIDVFGRGMWVLVDKEGLMARLRDMMAGLEVSPPRLPTQVGFLQNVHDFWYHALWTAKHLRRGELWWAKSGCDGRLKSLLAQMLEWHARATRGAGVDTWFRGRFLEEWADPRALKGLRSAFAHYDEQDIWHALWATMDLFRWLAVETAARWGYAYPVTGDEEVTGLVKDLSDPYLRRET